MFRGFSAVLLAFGLCGIGASDCAAETRTLDGVTVQASTVGIQVQVAQRDSRPRPRLQWRPPERRGPSQEPASARGYSDGYSRGLEDGRDRDRYDPVGSGSYRSGDSGYSRQYGSRDAYRNNYRFGFRQGYEDGYRDGARGRR